MSLVKSGDRIQDTGKLVGGIVLTGALSTFAAASPTTSFPPLSCDGRVNGTFWGLELLGNVAVWHTPDTRQTLPITTTLPLPGSTERDLFVIEDKDSVHLALATETGCRRNGLSFPVSLTVLSPGDTDTPVRTSCCTAAE